MHIFIHSTWNFVFRDTKLILFLTANRDIVFTCSEDFEAPTKPITKVIRSFRYVIRGYRMLSHLKHVFILKVLPLY